MTIPPGSEKIAIKILEVTWKIYTAWREKGDKKQQAEIDKLVESIQASKPLGRRVGESLSRSLQSLRLSDKTLNALRALDGDQVFHDEVGKRLSEGQLSAADFSQILREAFKTNDLAVDEIESVAALWLDAIHMGIGESPSLSHALQIQSSYRLEDAVSNVDQCASIIAEDTKQILQVQEVSRSIEVEHLNLSKKMFGLMKELVEVTSQPNVAQTILQKQFQNKFDKCREGLIFGAIDIAEQDFASLIRDMIEAGPLANKELLFRSHLNHSTLLLLKERLEEAKIALEKAREIFADDKRLHRHHAALLSHEGKREEALGIIRRLRELEPDEPKNIADEIALLHDLRRDGELERLVDSIKIEDADVNCSKSYALLRLERFEEAMTSARLATQLKPDAEGPWIALAYSVGFPVVKQLASEKHSQISPTIEESLRLDEAIKAAVKAEGILQKRGRKDLLDDVQGNLLAFYILACRHEEGLALALRMNLSSANSEVALGNMCQVFLINEKKLNALQASEALAAKLGTAESKIQRATILIFAGKAKAALDDLAELRGIDDKVAKDPHWIAAFADAHFALHHADEAISLLKEGLAIHPESALLNLELAKIMAGIQRDDQALEYFQRAEQLAPEHPEILSYFGQFLYFAGNWTGALEKFEKIGARSPLNPLFPRLLVCTYNAGKFDECLDHVHLWTSSSTAVNETVYGIGARTAIALNEWPLAKELLESLVAKGDSRSLENLKLLAKVYLRLDDKQEAYTLLSRSLSDESKDVEALALLGQVCAACGKYVEALQYHSMSIAVEPVSVAARAAFFGTMLGLPEGFECSPSYVKLHHDNIAILASHPSGILRAIRLERDDGELDIENIQREVEKSAEAAREVLEYSSQNPRPLQLLVADLGVQMFEGWRNFTRDSERGICMCSGTHEEQKTQFAAIEKSKFVAVDLVSLFTLHGLGKLGLLTNVFERVYAHISIMDAVVRELRETLAWRDSGRLTSVNGRMLMLLPQPEERELKIKTLSEIRDFLKSRQVILSGLREATKLEHFLPGIKCNSGAQNLMKPALVAYEKEAVLLSDDFVFRALSTIVKCPAFCSQALLRRASSKGLISLAEYQEAILTMHSWNYHFVSDDTGTLQRLSEREDFLKNGIAERVFFNLARSGIGLAENIRVLSGFLLFIWAKSEKGNSTSRSWMTLVWNTIERVDSSMRLAFKLITSCSSILALEPSTFSRFICFICECRTGDISKAHKVLEHSVRLANGYAKAPGDSPRKRRAWSIQAKTLEILKTLND
jgi:tetratricopeptide (TPR) repeat protein